MMVRFSCFHSPTHSQKPKKTVQMSTEAVEDYSQSQPKKDFTLSAEILEDTLSNGNDTNRSSSCVMQDSKSEGFKSVNGIESDNGADNIGQMRKCVSLGSGLVDYKGNTSDSLRLSSNMVHHESDFSVKYAQEPEKEVCENSETRLSGECTGDSSNHSTESPHAMVKSGSSPFLHSSLANLIHQSRSSEDLKALDSRRKDIELRKGKNVQEDYSGCRWEELPSKDFKIKRIEKWVMDLKHCPLAETDQLKNSDLRGQNASRTDAKALPGMDSVKKYISSLSSSATSVHLANHGLVVMPFLSSFSSLKVLDLSGNAIVRITAGALPRGLHILNLSKNSISTIEGLRELTRLRVLDLSYNRILRIGHGLASCSSLKELYLAGNRISEVEGLHRLLKLNVLDLRFNKLSTTKSLGQLAANYNSLHAISLEGNPAQKNIGDEHLKKHLVGLLPHLAYFNRQSIKSGAIKDSADRAARLGISAHQIDRGLRSESKSKSLRKSTHGRKSQPKSQSVASQGGRVRLPVKTTNDRRRFLDSSSKVGSLRPDLAIRRSQSEGLLGGI